MRMINDFRTRNKLAIMRTIYNMKFKTRVTDPITLNKNFNKLTEAIFNLFFDLVLIKSHFLITPLKNQSNNIPFPRNIFLVKNIANFQTPDLAWRAKLSNNEGEEIPLSIARLKLLTLNLSIAFYPNLQCTCFDFSSNLTNVGKLLSESNLSTDG